MATEKLTLEQASDILKSYQENGWLIELDANPSRIDCLYWAYVYPAGKWHEEYIKSLCKSFFSTNELIVWLASHLVANYPLKEIKSKFKGVFVWITIFHEKTKTR